MTGRRRFFKQQSLLRVAWILQKLTNCRSGKIDAKEERYRTIPFCFRFETTTRTTSSTIPYAEPRFALSLNLVQISLSLRAPRRVP